MIYNPLTGQASTTPYNPLSGMTTNINIGVAGDPEGVARAVVDVINTSYYRGGLGAQAYKL